MILIKITTKSTFKTPLLASKSWYLSYRFSSYSHLFKVEFTELFIQREIQPNSNLQHPIILELLLDPQFPFNLPKLFCRTNVNPHFQILFLTKFSWKIFQPSLADGRDFLEDAIERPWYRPTAHSLSSKSIIRSPTILLREVITSIPTFLVRKFTKENLSKISV